MNLRFMHRCFKNAYSSLSSHLKHNLHCCHRLHILHQERMGSFRGHALPGAYYIVVSLWWLANVLRIHNQNVIGLSILPKSSTWFPIPLKWLREHPVEPFIRIFIVIAGIFLELYPQNWVLVGKDGEFVEEHLNNYAHAAMYAAFMIWFLIEILQFYNVTQLPPCCEHVFASIALFVEGTLFFFHLDGRPKLDKLLHTLLYMIVFVTALVLLLEAWMKNSFLLLVFRVSLFLLQGTWFFQIAHSLHGVRPWKNTKPNQEFVAIAFAWHVIGLLVFIFTGFVIVSVKTRGCNCPPDRNQLLEEKCGIYCEERSHLMNEEDP